MPKSVHLHNYFGRKVFGLPPIFRRASALGGGRLSKFQIGTACQILKILGWKPPPSILKILGEGDKSHKSLDIQCLRSKKFCSVFSAAKNILYSHVFTFYCKSKIQFQTDKGNNNEKQYVVYFHTKSNFSTILIKEYKCFVYVIWNDRFVKFRIKIMKNLDTFIHKKKSRKNYFDVSKLFGKMFRFHNQKLRMDLHNVFCV